VSIFSAMKGVWICNLIIIIMIACSCESTKEQSVAYPPPPSADSIQVFLPGIVSRGNDLDFNSAYSPDGQTFYFTRSIKRKWTIYRTTFDGERWSKAEAAGFHDDNYSEADPAFGPDGSLYFISDRPRDAADTLKDFDIWYVKSLPGGKWTDPTNLKEVNSDSTEYYIAFAGNGNLYFASSRAGGFGLEDIYVSRHVNGLYQSAENLGSSVNSVFSDHDPALPKDEAFIIYTTVDKPGGFGEGDLYYSIQQDSGKWGESVHMDEFFNTPTYEYSSYFSPDYRYFFFSSKYDVMWTHVQTLPVELRELIR
jgi:WD40-like Beta Propeller Repeat